VFGGFESDSVLGSSWQDSHSIAFSSLSSDGPTFWDGTSHYKLGIEAWRTSLFVPSSVFAFRIHSNTISLIHGSPGSVPAVIAFDFGSALSCPQGHGLCRHRVWRPCVKVISLRFRATLRRSSRKSRSQFCTESRVSQRFHRTDLTVQPLLPHVVRLCAEGRPASFLFTRSG
jgi:hypothetical protein